MSWPEHLKGNRRRLALRVLSQVGREEGQKTFANALMDDDPGLQQAAGEFLKPLGPKNAAILPELRAALTGPNTSSHFIVIEVLQGHRAGSARGDRPGAE